MDRDKRWERVKEAYDLLVNGTGKKATDMVQAMQESYDEGVTDEFIKPIVNANFDGTIKEGDVVIFFNYRNDRAKELTIVLTQQDMPENGMKTIPGLQFYCMTPYDASFTGVHILFPKENVQNTLGEYLAANGKTQLHIAETEKYAHVTFFFDGGVDKEIEGATRVLVNSPKVATYDLQPEMSACGVTEGLMEALNSDTYDVIIINYANPDMVGHTGIIPAAIKAVSVVDECVGEVYNKVLELGGTMLITADHGNSEMLLDEDNNPFTAHTTNEVPLIVTNSHLELKEGGKLGDLAPTILQLLGLEIPAEMDGESLLK